MQEERSDPTHELWRSLRDAVMRRGADLHTAEDVAQEAWLRAVRRPPEDRARFQGWLYVVATRYLRKLRESERLQSKRWPSVARENSSPPAVAAEPTSLERL